MKHLSLLLKLLVLTNGLIFAQNWKIQHPYNISGARDIFMLNDTIGWLVGDAGMLFKTMDGGLNWLKQNIDSKNELHSVFFFDDKTGWIAGSEGLFRTIDGGENWIKTIETDYLQNVHFFNKDSGVVSTSTTIYFTHNGGDSFIKETVITDEDNYIMKMSFPNQKYGWIAVLSNFAEHGKLFHTSDSGITWTLQKSFTNDWVTSVFFTDTLNGWITLTTPVPDKYKRKIYHTSDGGKTWIPQPDNDSSIFYDLEDIYMIDTLNGWAVGVCGYYTNDGGQSWHQHFIHSSYLINDVQFNSIDKGWAVSTDKLSFSTDTGKTWNTYPYMANINSVVFLNDLCGYAVGEKGYIFKTVNGGENWIHIKQLNQENTLNKILVTKNNKILISAINTSSCEAILYLSSDSAKSFSVLKEFETHISSMAEVEEHIYVLSDSLYKINLNNFQIASKQLPLSATYTDMFFIENNTIWLTGYTGNPYSSNSSDFINSFLYTSTDNGNNWIKNDYEIGSSVINKIYFINNNKGFLIGNLGYLAVTITGGENWERADFDESPMLYDILFPSKDYGIIVSSSGIYRTVNGGESWVSVDIQNLQLLNMYFVNDSLGWFVGREGIIIRSESLFYVEDQISISNDNNKYEIKIFPNPADNKIYICYKSLNNVSYKMIDITGILYKNGYLYSGDNIDINYLKTGIYILELYSGKTLIAQEKILKR